jgi:hypothetical protein
LDIVGDCADDADVVGGALAEDQGDEIIGRGDGPLRISVDSGVKIGRAFTRSWGLYEDVKGSSCIEGITDSRTSDWVHHYTPSSGSNSQNWG